MTFENKSFGLKPVATIASQLKILKAVKNQYQYRSIMYLFFDTETTGLPRNWKAPLTDLNNWPRLVQLAYLFYDKNGNKISAGDFIIKPEGFTIPADASRIHGISTERAIREGHLLQTVLQDFQSLINQAEYLVAHNMRFDEKIVGIWQKLKEIARKYSENKEEFGDFLNGIEEISKELMSFNENIEGKMSFFVEKFSFYDEKLGDLMKKIMILKEKLWKKQGFSKENAVLIRKNKGFLEEITKMKEKIGMKRPDKLKRFHYDLLEDYVSWFDEGAKLAENPSVIY